MRVFVSGVPRDLTPAQVEQLGLADRTEPPPPPPPRSVAMWRARTIMKVTLWGSGTLFEAVQAAIANLSDPLQKASAEEALERGDTFDRDGVFVPMLMQVVGVDEPTMDEFMEQAAALPA